MFMETNGYHLPVKAKNDTYLGQLAYATKQLASPTIVKVAEAAGRGIAVVELLDWADAADIPNQYSFFKDLIGFKYGDDKASFAKQFQNQFGTLGNGRLEINDVLAFPVNIWGRSISKKLNAKVKEMEANKDGKEKPNKEAR